MAHLDIADVSNRIKPMARLKQKARNKLPKKDFALPGKGKGPEGKGAGSYPVPDKAHARAALSRVSANGSSEEKARVRQKVHAKFPDIGSGEKKRPPIYK